MHLRVQSAARCMVCNKVNRVLNSSSRFARLVAWHGAPVSGDIFKARSLVEVPVVKVVFVWVTPEIWHGPEHGQVLLPEA